MSNADVRVLFPNREKRKRTRRGHRPNRYLSAPSYDDMIKVAFTPTLSDIQKSGRTKVTFYLLQKEAENKNLFGYLKIVEDTLFPNPVDSYATLQHIYNDLLGSPNWHETVEDLIQVRSTKPNARVKNLAFMTKVRAQFNIPEPQVELVVAPEPIAAAPAPVVAAPAPVPVVVEPPGVAVVEAPAVAERMRQALWDPIAGRWNRVGGAENPINQNEPVMFRVDDIDHQRQAVLELEREMRIRAARRDDEIWGMPIWDEEPQF